MFFLGYNGFVVLVLDEDKEALAEQRRPYHVSEIN